MSDSLCFNFHQLGTRLAMVFLAAVLAMGHCLEAIAVQPTQVFRAKEPIELVESRFIAEKNMLVVQAASPLHFQVEDRLNAGTPATTTVTLRLFNAIPTWGFGMPGTPTGPASGYEVNFVAGRGAAPAETRIRMTLLEGYQVRAKLSPDAKQAILVFERRPDGTAPMRRGIVVRHLEYANARDLANVLSTMVPQGTGRIGADEARNNLVIDNTNGEFEAIEATIKELDRPSHQVVLEAQVVEINTNAARNLGLTYGTNISTTLQERPPESDGAGNSQPIPLQPIVRTSTSLQATLNMLQSSGQAKVLANPRVAALEGEESKMVTGERIPYFVTQISNNQVFQIKEDFLAGVELRIIPRVNEGRFVTARIHTNVSTITGTTPQGYPQLSTRESSAAVRVAAGETIVIGGLLQEREIELLSGIPFVSELPILGALFSSRQKDSVRTELVVFITPHILSDE